MQLTPRYDADPIIVLDGDPSAIGVPVIRQRRRLVEMVAGFSEEEWAGPSRCAGWTNRDVIVHLDSTNTFWGFSIAQGLAGEPTRFLATFDPVASPAELVAGSLDVPAAEVLDRFAASTEALCGQLAALTDQEWSARAEAPPGHVTVSTLAHHALWDSWVHERDVLVPLGVEPVVQADEVAACLRYAAALGPAFAITRGDARRGTLAVEVTDPDLVALVDVGAEASVRAGGTAGTADADLRLTGEAVPLLEALSMRRPLGQPVAPDASWMLSGLAETFEVEPA